MPDGRAFELEVAKRMRALGWKCELTPASNDFGADLICSVEDELLVVQCKCYNEATSIGVSAVQEVYTAVGHFKAKLGMVIYEGRPSRHAQKLAKSVDVRLVHASDLMPGWVFDRTIEGAQIRKREEAERSAAEAAKVKKRRAEQEAQDRQAQSNYAMELRNWKTERESWRKKDKHWDGGWSVGAAIAAFIGAIMMLDQGPAVDTWTGFGLIVSAAVIYFTKSPGVAPAKPIPPYGMTDFRKPSGVKVPIREIKKSGRTVIRCSRCNAMLRIPAGHSRLRIGCPKCGLSEIRNIHT